MTDNQKTYTEEWIELHIKYFGTRPDERELQAVIDFIILSHLRTHNKTVVLKDDD
jgi:hypothetical protein